MHVLNVRNVHDALPYGMEFLRLSGVPRDSRNGPVLVADSPVTTVYAKPEERVIFWPERDANPFFHVMESLWMLAGRNDVQFCTRFVKTMQDFSDDGKTFHGAYGWRWRNHFGFDQLGHVIEALKANPEDRRQVVQMWDATIDLGRSGKDLPCNTQIFFAVSTQGKLDMTVLNRSNDMIWGAYGANAVHFSYLQEYVARGVGIEVGRYFQVSNNFHAYRKTFDPLVGLADKAPDPLRSGDSNNPYATGEVKPYPLISTDLKTWQEDLSVFMSEGAIIGFRDPFFRRVANPILLAHNAYKNGKGHERYIDALELLGNCEATDWRKACEEWINRRYAAFKGKEARASDDGVSYE